MVLQKKGENIKMELIKISEAEENNKERNYLLWKKDKEFFEFDIPTFLEMIKKENDQMTVGDIKNMLYKNLEKINNDVAYSLFKQELRKINTV